MTNKKCNKFEELFTREDETELLEHIQSCEDCRNEYEKMQKVSILVKEAKPLFVREKFRNRKIALTMVAGITFFCLTGFVMLSWVPNYNYDQAVESDVYPMDEYGLVEFY